MLGTYVIRAEKIALIDPGPAVSLQNLLAGLASMQIDPKDVCYILITHIHLDHSGGLAQVLKYMPDALVIVHERGIKHLVNPSRLWESSQQTVQDLAATYGQPEPVAENKLLAAKEGSLIRLGDLQFKVLLTPGHAPHHISFLETSQGYLFTGDSAGIRLEDTGILHPSTPPPFNLKLTLASVDKLIEANPSHICYAHYGCKPDGVSQLVQYRKLLISWGKVIAQHLGKNENWKIIYEDILSQIPEDILKIDLSQENCDPFS